MWALQALSIVARLRRPALSELLAGCLYKEPVEARRCEHSPEVWREHVLPALLGFLLEHLEGTMAATQGLAGILPGAKVRQYCMVRGETLCVQYENIIRFLTRER